MSEGKDQKEIKAGEEKEEEEFQDAYETFEKDEDEETPKEAQDKEDDGPNKENEERRAREDALSPEERTALRVEAVELKKKGNEAYLSEDHEEAVRLYQEALDICPLEFSEERSFIFSNMGASRLKQGLQEEARGACTSAIDLNPTYVKALARRALIHEELDKPHEALEDVQRVLKLDPRHKECLAASLRLPDKVKEKDEKMKAEMFDNLKKLGNMVLNPFGLSTENFKFTQDPNTGGYSVNFSK